MPDQIALQADLDTVSTTVASGFGRGKSAMAAGAAGDGVTADDAVLSDVDASEYPLVLDPEKTFLVSQDLTLSKGVISEGGIIKRAAGVTVTFSGPFDAGLNQALLAEDPNDGAGFVFGPGSVDRFFPQWWGARGDGVTSDTAALQAAFDQPVLNGSRGTVEIPQGTYRIGSPLTVDIGFTSLVSSGAVIDASPITAGHAILLKGSPTASNDLYQQNRAALEGIDLVGNSRSGSVIGVLNETTGATSNRTAHNLISRVRIRTFGIGISFGDYAYLVTAYDLNIHDCGVCVDSPAGTADSGERITFYNSNLFNSDQGFRLANPNADFHMIGGSLDYISGRYVNLSGGTFFGSHLHIEGNYDADYWFYVTGNGRLIDISKSHLVVNNATKTAFEIGYSDSSVGFGGLVLRDIYTTWADNYKLRHLIAGAGRAVVSGWSHPNNNRMPQVGAAANRLWDGSFETGVTEWSLYGGDPPSRDNSKARTGTWSLYFHPTVNGNSCSARVEVGVEPGQSARISFYGWSSGLDATSDFYVSMKWLGVNGTVINQIETGYTADFGGGGVWSHLRNVLEATAPAGAVEVAIILELRSANTTSSVWVDDVDVSIV